MEMIERLRDTIADLVAGRGRLIVGALVVLIGAVVVMNMGSGDSTPRAPAQPRGVDEAVKAVSPSLGGQLDGAEDESARLVLRTASVAMESLFAETQSFAGAPASMARFEPNVVWKSSGANAAANEVNVTVAPAGDAYVLSTLSSSGKTYSYSRDAQAGVTRACEPACGTW